MTDQNPQNALLGKIAAYTEILAKDPKSTIFVSLSEAYRKMGMLDDAHQIISKGLETHADFSPAHIVLARILCQQGEYSASEASFKMALEYDPESLAALVGYARLHILLGKEAEARQLLLEARELSPADPVINKLLLSLPEEEPEGVTEPVETQPVVTEDASIEDVAEDEQEAEGESSVPPLASATLAELYQKQGLTDQALEVYRQLSTEDPDNLELRRRIRDLEEGQTAVDIDQSPEVAESEELEPQETPVAEAEEPSAPATEDDQAPAVEADSPLATVAASGLTPQDEKALETLNGWLDSIQQRRENV